LLSRTAAQNNDNDDDDDDDEVVEVNPGQNNQPGFRAMNTAPQSLDQINDAATARKSRQLYHIYNQLEIMTTPPTDGSAPAFNGMANIPENHSYIVTISECNPNTAGGDRKNITPDQKRRPRTLITVTSTNNRMLRDGTFRSAMQAIGAHMDGNPNYGTDPRRLEDITRVQVNQDNFKVAFALDGSRHNRLIYNDLPTRWQTRRTTTGASNGDRSNDGGRTNDGGTGTTPATPASGSTNNGFVDLNSPNTPFVAGILNSMPATPPYTTQRNLFGTRRNSYIPPPNPSTGGSASGAAASMPVGSGGVPRCALGQHCPDRASGLCRFDHS